MTLGTYIQFLVEYLQFCLSNEVSTDAEQVGGERRLTGPFQKTRFVCSAQMVQWLLRNFSLTEKSSFKDRKKKKKHFLFFVRRKEENRISTQLHTRERGDEPRLRVELCLILTCSSTLQMKCVAETHLINRQQIKPRK